MNNKNKTLGQFFTPVNIINFMIKLIKKGKNILEPSCGPGYFINELEKNGFKNITGIEIDKNIYNNVLKKNKNILWHGFF